MAIRIVTDSTADIPEQIARQYGISVVPLNVHFGTLAKKDQVELTSDGFFEKLRTDPNHPRTSQPSPGEFAGVYRYLLEKGDQVVSIHLSGSLSGTLQSASIAAESLSELGRVAVIDSRTASMGLGLRVIEAAEMAQNGARFEEVVEAATQSISRSGIFFAVDTLDYLYANGRIGKATHLLGSLLSMKPILTLVDGVVTPLDKVRGKSKVITRLRELTSSKVPAGTPVRIAVVHGSAPDQAGALLSELKPHLNVEQEIVTGLGAVIGTHTGPGTIAVAYLLPR